MPLSHTAAMSGLQRGTVFIVEDDALMRALLTSLALELGFQSAASFAGSEAALERLEYDSFGLGIVDLNLGQQLGEALIASIRSHPRATIHSMPILVASTAGTGARVRSAMLAGADAFLRKPFSIANLTRQIDFAIARAAKRNASAPRLKPQHGFVDEPGDVLALD